MSNSWLRYPHHLVGFHKWELYQKPNVTLDQRYEEFKCKTGSCMRYRICSVCGKRQHEMARRDGRWVYWHWEKWTDINDPYYKGWERLKDSD